MARIVSFVVLLAILVVIGVLFFRVMAEFILPMFLAAILVILFKPLHEWFLARCGGRARIAAGLTALTILVVFLVPLLGILAQASAEGMTLYGSLKRSQVDLRSIADGISSFGTRVGLEVQTEELERSLSTGIQEWLAPLALSTTQFLGNFILGLIVMIVSLYFFLVDGPVMIQTIMRLSPLDNRYEEQLVSEFANLSRAVVAATVAAALAQGLLAGAGFYFAGLKSVFLLMVLTMLLAMVPFVGAVSVWAPCCLWLFFYEHRTAAAVLLAIYGLSIISTVDNVIKPLILHGRSNLHPLLALLSVLGGVKALGPIGIFVGPMVVALLQTLLKMVQTELVEMGRPANTAAKPQPEPTQPV